MGLLGEGAAEQGMARGKLRAPRKTLFPACPVVTLPTCKAPEPTLLSLLPGCPMKPAPLEPTTRSIRRAWARGHGHKEDGHMGKNASWEMCRAPISPGADWTWGF